MDDEDDMPLIPIHSRHQDRVPVKRGRKSETAYIANLPPDKLAEREDRIKAMIQRAAKGLPLFPGDNDD